MVSLKDERRLRRTLTGLRRGTENRVAGGGVIGGVGVSRSAREAPLNVGSTVAWPGAAGSARLCVILGMRGWWDTRCP